ncbi:MFS transporter [Novosphingobium sp.]|uniref:MFS transporter n=1 Tax=Novosphingobium sp. TaxID=1874826 RepID=UPI0027372C9B|nr:MFS transporter [Novosphingobium sp.]MDP3907763.1 MFS transporter [Novosphingobium sp.]
MTTAASAGPAPGARLPGKLKFFHGLGSIAYGIKDNGFSTFLLLFYNQVMGMDPRMVSLALAIALVIDGIIDPIIGYLSDRTYSPWGRRLPWLYIAPIPLAFAWAALWTTSSQPTLLGLVVMAVIVRMLISACEVPSIALVPELTHDYDERTTLMRYRFLFGWGGGLLVMLLAYTVFLAPAADGSGGMLDASGYQAYGLFGAVVMAAAVLISAVGQHSRAAGYPPRARSPFNLRTAFSELRESLSHPAFLVLLGGGGLAYTSQGITFSLSNYLYLYVWRFDGDDLKIYPLVLFASVVACFLLLPKLHTRWGKRDTAVATAVIGASLWALPFGLRAAGLWPQVGTGASTAGLFAIFFFSNVFSVSAMISASSMVADVVEASEEQTGRRSEGAFFAGNMFMAKCATGLGIFLTGQMLYLAGMPDNAKPGEVPAAVIDNLANIYISAVVAFAIGIALILRRFPITRADHEARVAALAAARTNPDAGGLHP